MTQNYEDVFGSDTVPSTQYSYAAISLTANTTFQWPQLATGANLIAEIMQITPSAAYNLTMPAANQVSTASPTVMYNVGAFTITVLGSTGATITTIAAGTAKLIYITSNATAAGTWGVFTYGTGTSAADASALAGYGTKATGATLSTKFAVTEKTANWTIATTDRAKLFNVASGSYTGTLPDAIATGDDFFILARNSGSGSVTYDCTGSDTIDSAASLTLAPGESAFIICSGTYWYSVGYGRSTQFQFTKLVLDVSAGGSFTLTSAQASNKLLQFTGTPASNVTIVVPNVVAVYYAQNSYTGAYTTAIKTAAGATVTTATATRSIVYCDGTDVVLAQTSSLPASSLTGGVAGAVAYQSAVDTTAFTAAGTAEQLLTSNGTSAPTWVNRNTVAPCPSKFEAFQQFGGL